MSQHTDFAQEIGATSFLMSAKTGDQVHSAFYRVAAGLAGVALTRPEVQVQSKVVEAELINYQKDDPNVAEPDWESAREHEGAKKRRCVIS